MNYPKDFECLIDSFRRLPGVGYKSAERMAYHVLNLKQEYINLFIEALSNIKKLEKCQICGNLSQDSECLICKDKSRNKNVICVVQNIKDLYAIEKSNSFNGVYHVLNGVISPSKGILPEDLKIEQLIKRASKAQEIILATNPNIDGETTALFISTILKDLNIKITRLAYGLPMGGNLEYSDEVTISKSFENRKSL